MDPDTDTDPVIFVIDLQMPTKNGFKKFFFSSDYYFLKVHFYHFQRYKAKKKSHKAVPRNQGFSYYFCLVIEGYGFGSRRLKNIRIRNTAFYIASNIEYKIYQTAKRTASV
jgi:hypothetical protein